MLTWLGVATALAFATAVIPFAAIEVFLLGLAVHRPDIPWLALGAAVATGQVAGKTVHYAAARGLTSLPRRRCRRDRPPTRLRRALDKATERAHRDPRGLTAVLGLSALSGLPPFGATTVVAGATAMPWRLFVGTALAGRLIRYSAIAATAAQFA